MTIKKAAQKAAFLFLGFPCEFVKNIFYELVHSIIGIFRILPCQPVRNNYVC